jgi:hypothetical protein
MTLRQVATMVLLGMACTTIATGRAGAQTPDAGPDQPGVVITASSPTHVQFRADAGDTVVLLTPVHRPTAASRGPTALYGFLIGVAGGLALGFRAAGDAGGEGDTGAGSALIFAPLMFGLLGLGVGALVGALSGPSDSP